MKGEAKYTIAKQRRIDDATKPMVKQKKIKTKENRRRKNH
jgi:hypothetical protein